MKPSGLEEKSKEILDYAKSQGFSIFYSKELSADYDLEAVWDRPEEWREFFNIAKNEDVKTIIANIQVFEKDAAFRIEDADHSTVEDLVNKAVVDPKELSEIDGKVGLYKFSWIKSGTIYSLSEITDWYKEYKSAMFTIESELVRQRPMGASTSFDRERQDEEIPEALRKSEEELVNELIEFIGKESPSPDTHSFFMLERMFWAEKGIERFSFNPKVELIKTRVDMKAQKILGDERTKEEKEKMPELVERCIEWCKKNNMKKVTQGDMGAFLTDNEISFSKDGQRTLWQKVNVMLRSM